MEKLSQIKTKFLKFLSKQPSVSLAGFQNPPLKTPCRSPSRVSIIPKEARRKKHRSENNFGAKEPTSPKVSCMGQVQSKKKRKKAKKNKRVLQQPPVENGDSVGKQSGKALVVLEEKASRAMIEAPTLDMMQKFASGRGSLYDFDAKLAER